MSKFKLRFALKLIKNDTAKLYQISKKSKSKLKLKEKGKWTMVYDEGFDVSFRNNKYTFFVFSKYKKNNKKDRFSTNFVSQCYMTLIGWYSKNNKHGCFYAIKVTKHPEQITNGEAKNKKLVVQGTVKKLYSQDKSKKNSKGNYQIEEKILPMMHFSREYIEEKLLPIKNIAIKNFSTNKQVGYNTNTLFLETKTNIKTKTLAFLELNTQFKDHSEIAKRINSIPDMLWTASSYDTFNHMTIGELNRFVGRFSFKSLNQNNKKSHKIARKKLCFTNKQKKRVSKVKSINYRKYMSAPRSQGRCGSCYAVSTINMLEARLRMKYPKIPKKLIKLSIDHVLKCSVYNQGCKGGYSFLVLKFFKFFELLHEKCFQKVTTNNYIIGFTWS